MQINRMMKLLSNREDKNNQHKMRIKIDQDHNAFQAGHSKCSFYLSAGTFTLENSVDMENWKTVKSDIEGDDIVHVGGFTPNEFFRITENSEAEWDGVVTGANQLI